MAASFIPCSHCDPCVASSDPVEGAAAIESDCLVHIAQGDIEKILFLNDALISWMIKMGLTVAEGNVLELVQEEVRWLLKETLVYIEGTPQPRHREKVASILKKASDRGGSTGPPEDITLRNGKILDIRLED